MFQCSLYLIKYEHINCFFLYKLRFVASRTSKTMYAWSEAMKAAETLPVLAIALGPVLS
jgi:hypothetical protein